MEPQHSQGAMICVVLDDFGLDTGVNFAAHRLADLGRLQAVGALVGAPAWRRGTGLLRRLDAEGLDIGLHLDLTEAPLLRMSRRPLSSLVALAYSNRLDRHVLQYEIDAQLDAFETELGHPPAFVDGHQHVHQLPVVRDALNAELTERYGSALPWLRSTRGPGRSLKARVIGALGARGLEALARKAGAPQNRRLLGVYDFRGGAARYRQLLASWLDEAQDGDLLMCHAGLPVSQADPLHDARQAEYAVLADPSFERMIESRRITLRPMSRILARGNP